MRKRKELEELFLWDAFLKYLQWFLGTYLIRAKFLYLEWSNQRKLTHKLLRCYEMDESHMESEGERERVWGAGRAGELPKENKWQSLFNKHLPFSIIWQMCWSQSKGLNVCTPKSSLMISLDVILEYIPKIFESSFLKRSKRWNKNVTSCIIKASTCPKTWGWIEQSLVLPILLIP